MTFRDAYARVILVCVALALSSALQAADDPSTKAQDAALAQIERLRSDGKVAEALAAADQELKAASGANSARVSKLLHDSAIFAMLLEHYGDAEKRIRRAATVESALTGAAGGNMAAIVNTLSQILVRQARYAEGTKEAERAVAIAQGAFGPEHPNVGAALDTLGKAQYAGGEIAKAEASYRKSIAIEERGLGPEHPAVAGTLNDLALLLNDQLRLEEAEALQNRVVAIAQKAFGENHPNVATALSGLAHNYLDQARWDDASALLTRALAIRQKGTSKSDIADALSDLAWSDMGRGDAASAVKQFNRALEVRASLATQDPESYAKGLANLARALREQKNFAEAARQSERALDVVQKAGLATKPWVAPIMTGLASALIAQNKATEAEDKARQALALAPERGLVRAAALRVLAEAELAQSKARPALNDAREAAAIVAARKADAAAAELRGDVRLAIKDRDAFVLPVRAAFAVAQLEPKQENTLRKESFEVAQRSGEHATSYAVWRMASRIAAHNDSLGKLLREQQTLTLRLPEIETQYAQLLASSDAAVRARADDHRRDSDRIRSRLKQIDQNIRWEQRFGLYAQLTDIAPIPVSDFQALLKDDEAAVQYLIGEKESFVFAVTKLAVAWAKFGTAAALTQDVTALRRQLDPSQWQTIPPNIESFDRARAYRLYQQLWAPIAATVEGKAKVFVVADGPLTSLPFSVLVTAAPSGGAVGDGDPQALRDTAWLIKRHALITLPSLSSLRALRTYASQTSGDEPFSGFGDPDLGWPNDSRGARRREVGAFFRGRAPDLARLAELGSLPATAIELKALAGAAGGDATKDLWLGKRATEGEIKGNDLSRKRVVAFSTHGLMAGELDQGEPGLVFTLPKKATARDDGFLAASEIADLKLDADWVILSACNTAAGDKPGAEGLSGLARAFFLAGAKAMMVSHWSVWDDASASITTGTLLRLKTKQAPDRAEALRQAMLALMADRGAARFAHPAAWAPFVLVGDR